VQSFSSRFAFSSAKPGVSREASGFRFLVLVQRRPALLPLDMAGEPPIRADERVYLGQVVTDRRAEFEVRQAAMPQIDQMPLRDSEVPGKFSLRHPASRNGNVVVCVHIPAIGVKCRLVFSPIPDICCFGTRAPKRTKIQNFPGIDRFAPSRRSKRDGRSEAKRHSIHQCLKSMPHRAMNRRLKFVSTRTFYTEPEKAVKKADNRVGTIISEIRQPVNYTAG
jgi:hypothetical protein